MENEPIRVLHIVPNMQAGGLETLIMNIYMILVMFYSFIIDVLTWYQPIFIISFIIALSNWNIKEAKKECEYTR